MYKQCNVSVRKQNTEPIESMIKRFNRSVKDEQVFIQLKEKSYYKSKGQLRRETKRRNKRRLESSNQNTNYFME